MYSLCDVWKRISNARARAFSVRVRAYIYSQKQHIIRLLWFAYAYAFGGAAAICLNWCVVWQLVPDILAYSQLKAHLHKHSGEFVVRDDASIFMYLNVSPPVFVCVKKDDAQINTHKHILRDKPLGLNAETKRPYGVESSSHKV